MDGAFGARSSIGWRYSSIADRRQMCFDTKFDMNTTLVNYKHTHTSVQVQESVHCDANGLNDNIPKLCY